MNIVNCRPEHEPTGGIGDGRTDILYADGQPDYLMYPASGRWRHSSSSSRIMLNAIF